MILKELKNIKSGKKELREFGIVIGIALLVIGGILLYKGKIYPWLFIAAAVFIGLGIIIPSILKPLQKVWMGFAVVMGFIMSNIIMSLFFYIGFTTMNILTRIVGKDLLKIKIEKDKKTYWIPREQLPFDKKRYENQF